MSKQSKRAAFAHRIREQRRTGEILKLRDDVTYVIGVVRNVNQHSMRQFADIGAVFSVGL
jgi:hypothetical protein